jgi:hypothetical protein
MSSVWKTTIGMCLPIQKALNNVCTQAPVYTNIGDPPYRNRRDIRFGWTCLDELAYVSVDVSQSWRAFDLQTRIRAAAFTYRGTRCRADDMTRAVFRALFHRPPCQLALGPSSRGHELTTRLGARASTRPLASLAFVPLTYRWQFVCPPTFVNCVYYNPLP